MTWFGIRYSVGISVAARSISSKMSAKAPDVYSGRGPCGKGGFCFAERQFVLSGGQSAAAQPWQHIYRSFCSTAPSDGTDGIDGGAGSHQDHHNAEPWGSPCAITRVQFVR